MISHLILQRFSNCDQLCLLSIRKRIFFWWIYGTLWIDDFVIIENNQAIAKEESASNPENKGTGGGIAIDGEAIVNVKSGTISNNSADKGQAILQNNVMNLSGNPTIDGDIYLTTSHVIHVIDEYNGSNILINMDRDDFDTEKIDETYQEGRNVLVYDDSLNIPTPEQVKKSVLHDLIQADGYYLNYEGKANTGLEPNKHIIELSTTEIEDKPVDPPVDPVDPVDPPVDPENPNEPSEPEVPETSEKPDVPDTKDNGQIVMWSSLFMMSLLGFVTSIMTKKQNQEK